jgi:hypothetical protein
LAGFSIIDFVLAHDFASGHGILFASVDSIKRIDRGLVFLLTFDDVFVLVVELIVILVVIENVLFILLVISWFLTVVLHVQ